MPLPLLQIPLAIAGKEAKEQGRVVSSIWAPLTRYLMKKLSGFSSKNPLLTKAMAGQTRGSDPTICRPSHTNSSLTKDKLPITICSHHWQSNIKLLSATNQYKSTQQSNMKHCNTSTERAIIVQTCLLRWVAHISPWLCYFSLNSNCSSRVCTRTVSLLFSICWCLLKKRRVFKVKTSLYPLTRPPSQCN